MKSKLLFAFLVASFMVRAQSLNPDWVTALGQGTDVHANDYLVDASGNTYMVGYFSGSDVDFSMGTTTASLHSSVGGTDSFIAKYQNDGQLEWAHSFGTAATERFNGITINSSGELIVVGYVGNDATGFDLDPGAGTATITGKSDALVVKFSASGDYIDHFLIGNENTTIQEFYDVAVNAGDSIYVVGYDDGSGNISSADMDPGTGTAVLHNNTAEKQAMMGAYKDDFSFLFGRRTQSNAANDFYKIFAESDGLYLVARWGLSTTNLTSLIFEDVPTYATGYGSNASLGKHEFISGQGNRSGVCNTLIKLQNNGSRAWNKTLYNGTSTNSLQISDLISDDNSLYVIGRAPEGYFIESTKRTIGTAGVHGFFHKLNKSTGALEIEKFVKSTTTATDYIYAIDTLANGNLILSGVFNGSNTMDLDPGTGTFNISAIDNAAYWSIYIKSDFSFVEGGVIATTDSDVGSGMLEPFLKNTGNDQLIFSGYHDRKAEFSDGTFGPFLQPSGDGTLRKGVTLSRLAYTPNQPPVASQSFSDTTVATNSVAADIKVQFLEDYFSDPESDELTFSFSSDDPAITFDTDVDVDGTGNFKKVLFITVPANYLGNFNVTVTATATGGTADQTFNVSVEEVYGLKATYPLNAQALVPLDTSIGFSYKVALQTADLESQIRITSEMDGNLEGTFTITSDSVIFKPTQPFYPGDEIRVTINDQVESLNGEFVSAQTFSFTTKGVDQAVNPISFEAYSLDYLSQRARWVIPADIDDDGDLDLVGGGEISLDVFYMLNDGTGNFGTAQVIDGNADAHDIRVADVNADGHLDIVTLSRQNRGLNLYLNDGNLSFTKQVVDGTSGDFRALRVVDYNLDGALDLFSVYFGADRTWWYQNDGNQSFSTKQLYGSYESPRDLALYDFTNDGFLNYITLSGYNSTEGDIRLAESNRDISNVNFLNATTLVTGGAEKLIVIDIDLDNDHDVVYTTNSAINKLGLLINNGDGTFTDNIISNKDGYGLTAGDIDADGDIDLFYASSGNNEFIMLLNDGALNFTESVIHTGAISGDIPSSIRLADVDGDLDLDIITSVINSTSGNQKQITILKNKIIHVEPPVLAAQLADFAIDEDQMDVVITDRLDTLFTGTTLEYTTTSSQEDVVIGIDGTVLSVSASNDFFGNATIALSATNSGGSANQSFDIIVNSVNDLPELSQALPVASGDEDSYSQAIDLSVYFTDVESTQLTYAASVTTGETIVSLELAGTELLLSSLENEFGTAQVQISVTDGDGGRTDELWDVTVNAVNDLPEFALSRELVEVGKNFSSTETISITDLSPANESDQVISYSIDPVSVAFANVSIDQSSGLVTVTSVSGEFGSQLFTVTADDGQSINNTATQTFTLTVLDNQPPTIVNTPTDMSFDEDATQRVLVSDVAGVFTDPDSDAMTFSVQSDNSEISLQIEGNSLSYSTAAHYFGTATITLTANDGSSSTSTDFVLTINPINDAPVVANPIADQVFTEDVAFSFTVPADVFSDVDDTDLSLDFGTLPDFMIFHPFVNIISGNPGNDEVGTYTITITASDGEFSVSESFDITIENVNDSPEFISALPDMTIDEDAGEVVLMDLDTIARDVDNASFAITVWEDSGVLQITINQDNEVLITAPDNINGSGEIFISLEDEEYYVEKSFMLTITAVNDEPVFTIDQNTLVFNSANETGQAIIITPGFVPGDETSQTVTYSVSSDDETVVTATVNGNQIDVTPIVDTFGSQTFTVTADDGQTENNLYSLQFTVTVNEPLALKNSILSIHPNPTTSYLMIDAAIAYEAMYQIIDQQGRVVMKGKMENSRVDVSVLEEGLYFLQISGEGISSMVSRFIKN